MKPVPPTLREKKRYIAFKLMCEARMSKRDAIDVILYETLRFFGDLKTSDFDLWIMDFDEKDMSGFLVCDHKYQGEVVAALSLITSMGKHKAAIQVLGVSGTIKALKRKFLNDGTIIDLKGDY